MPISATQATPSYTKESYLILMGLFETVLITKKSHLTMYTWYNTEWLENFRVLLYEGLETQNWKMNWSK